MSEENIHRGVTGFQFGEPPRIARCPYCGVGRPLIPLRQDFGVSGNRRWAVFSSICCGGMLLAVGPIGITHEKAPIKLSTPAHGALLPKFPIPLDTIFSRRLKPSMPPMRRPSWPEARSMRC